jgi:hypothetical protein
MKIIIFLDHTNNSVRIEELEILNEDSEENDF